MKVNLNEIKPNPYRKDLQGVFNEDQIKRLIESYKMSDYGKNMRFETRKKNGRFELVYGHHRMEAFKRLYGKNNEVDMVLRDYTDEQMLVEMIRENMTKDNNWFTRMQAFQMTKKYLEKKSGVENLNTSNRNDKAYQGIGHRQIAEFLSKDQATVSASEVMQLLNIAENLDEDLKKEIRGTKISGLKPKDKKLSFTQAVALSTIKDKEEQKDIAKSLDNSIEQSGRKHQTLIQEYKKAPENVKKEIRLGKRDIAFINIGKSILPEHKIEQQLDSGFALQLFLECNNLVNKIKRNSIDSFKNKDKEVLVKIYEQVIKVLLSEIKKGGHKINEKTLIA